MGCTHTTTSQLDSAQYVRCRRVYGLPCARGDGLEPQGRGSLSVHVCRRKQKLCGSRCIVRAAAIPGVANMKRPSLKTNPVHQHRVQRECAWRTTGSAAAVLFLFLSPTLAWPQAAVPVEPSVPAHEQQTQQSESTGDSATPPDAATLSKPQTAVVTLAPDPTPVGHKTDSYEGKQTKRMFWVIPNFAAVSADTEVPPLNVRGKFALATQDSVDYSSFVWTGLLAGQSMALRSYPELHNGLAGYSRYYWRAFADQASGSFFTEAIVPAVTHEDPRYYTLGHGGFFRRAGYALSRVFVTKTDSGGRSFNYSEIVGNGMEAGLSNFYYPPEERSLRNTAVNWVSQLEAASLNNIIREFWPDIRHKALRQR
jgi:hypothetical protein